MQTVLYERIPFYVRVPIEPITAENIKEMAEWCGGEIRTEGRGARARKYIKVPVHQPLKERQTKAFIGDRILFSITANGFKVYTPKTFDKSFRKAKHLSRAEAERAGVHPPIENKRRNGPRPKEPKPEPKMINKTFADEIAKARAKKDWELVSKLEEISALTDD